MSVNAKCIVTSERFKHSDDGFKYFIGYKESEIVNPNLCRRGGGNFILPPVGFLLITQKN